MRSTQFIKVNFSDFCAQKPNISRYFRCQQPLIILGLTVLTLGLPPSSAQARGTEMFVCTSPDGVRTYQNSDSGNGCVPLNLNPITVMPVPKHARKPGSGSDSMGSTADPQSTGKSRRTAALDNRESGDFNAKDDRMKILQEELRIEETKLKSLQDEYKGGVPDRLGSEKNYQKYLDRVARLEKEIKLTTENIDILKSELIRLSE